MARHGRITSLVVGLAVTLLGSSSLLADPISMGPQAMEGDLKVSPGTVLMAGYDFTIPGSHPEVTVQLVNPMVVFQAQCVSGGDAGPIVVFLAGDPITVPQNSSAWYPSGDQHSPLVYQGSVVVPDLCGGGLITLRKGGTFTANLQASDQSHSVHVRWHYSANGSSGSWSGTGSFRPGPIRPPS
jgi:hypothetical protein